VVILRIPEISGHYRNIHAEGFSNPMKIIHPVPAIRETTGKSFIRSVEGNAIRRRRIRPMSNREQVSVIGQTIPKND
jgi:hypothetical protein